MKCIRLLTMTILSTMLYSISAFGAGALAIDHNHGTRYGYSYDYRTMEGATNRALRECGRGCRIVKTFRRGCAAYAADQSYRSTIYGWATDPSAHRAKRRAKHACRRQGGRHCVIRVWACNSY